MASCGDDEQPLCVGNQTRLCACPDRTRQGVQACSADGSSWGACDCSGQPREGTGGTSGGTEPLTPLVGRSCVASADCGEGLTCYTATSNDFLGGGAPGGYCSTACTEDAQCTAIDRQSECVASPDGSALCIRTCLSLDPTSLGESKCLDRRDVACQSEAYLNLADFTGLRQNGWCYPQCASDEDCPGRRCDLARGICVDTVTTGLAIGEACTANAQCAGRICVSSQGVGFCSAPCVFSVPIGCGYGLAPTGERAAGCFTPFERGFLSSEGDGDVGVCFELCSTAADCTQPGWICQTDDAIQARLSRPGVCLPPQPTDAGTDAGDAGAVDASAN